MLKKWPSWKTLEGRPTDLVNQKDLADAIKGAEGKTSYTHIAYANSADGTDGFYVGGGTNLLTKTDKDTSITSHTTDSWPAWANIDTGFSFEHGKTYTFSVEAKNSTDKIAEASIRVWEYSTNTQVGIYAFPADGKRHSVTFTIPNDSHNYHLWFYAGHAGIIPGVDVTTTYHHPKLEFGNVATPWSPAPSEAHPIYMGIYSDNVPGQSTDPSKYIWTLTLEGHPNNLATIDDVKNAIAAVPQLSFDSTWHDVVKFADGWMATDSGNNPKCYSFAIGNYHETHVVGIIKPEGHIGAWCSQNVFKLPDAVYCNENSVLVANIGSANGHAVKFGIDGGTGFINLWTGDYDVGAGTYVSVSFTIITTS